jgi:hypothetical protein
MTRGQPTPMTNPEQLAQWYFRLNGCLTIPNFVLHPIRPGSARTDVDVIGFRFATRCELSSDVIDDEPFAKQVRPCLWLAEVKTRYVSLNKSWRDHSGRNIECVLAAIGIVESGQTADVARALVERGVWGGEPWACSLFFVGDSLPEELRQQFPDVPHRNWAQVLSFIYGRFRRFDRLKTQHEQWDETGKTLWRLSAAYSDADTFERQARTEFNLRSDDAA